MTLEQLAASIGKPITYLRKAVSEAATGNVERLKEFGIRAKSEGEKTIYTFKGTQAEVENTKEALYKYILSL